MAADGIRPDHSETCVDAWRCQSHAALTGEEGVAGGGTRGLLGFFTLFFTSLFRAVITVLDDDHLDFLLLAIIDDNDFHGGRAHPLSIFPKELLERYDFVWTPMLALGSGMRMQFAFKTWLLTCPHLDGAGIASNPRAQDEEETLVSLEGGSGGL
jgi:hypothetical protein